MEKIHKRLTSATKIIVIIMTVCLVFLFHKIQHNNSKQDFDAINTIITNAKESAGSTNQIDEQIRIWLSKRDQSAFRLNYYSRVQLSSFLIKSGIDSSHLRSSKQKTDGESFSLIRIGKDGLEQKPFYYSDKGLFKDIIDVYSVKVAKYEIYLVTKLDTGIIDFTQVSKKLEESNRSYLDFLKRITGKKFSKEDEEETLNDVTIKDLAVSASLMHDTIRLSFTSTNPNAQRNFIPIILDIRATVSKLDTTLSLLDLAGKGNEVLDTATISAIRQKYGQLTAETAMNQSNAKYLDYFNDVDILGFKIPYESCFIIVVIFELLLALSLASSLSIARKHRWKGVFTVIDDDLFEPLVANPVLRFISWVLVPASSMLMAYPGQFPSTLFSLICLAICLVAFIALFVLSLLIPDTPPPED